MIGPREGMAESGATGRSHYRRTNGFTWHSLGHTFITDVMEASGNNVALVMSYSGHKSLQSYKNLSTRPNTRLYTY